MSKEKGKSSIAKTGSYKHVDLSSDSSIITIGSERDCFVSHGRYSGGEVTTDLRIRPSFTRSDYDYYRKEESNPVLFSELIKKCRTAYKKVGIVRTVFDMMIDFIANGFDLVSTDKRSRKILKAWQRQVKLNDAVEECAKHLLLDANVVVKRVTALLDQNSKRTLRSKASADLAVDPIDVGVDIEVPWRYIFVDIIGLKWLGGNIARMANKQTLALDLSNDLISSVTSIVNNNKSKVDYKYIPKDIREAVNGGLRHVVLDMDKLYVAHIKKDCWEDWAYPFLGAVLPDIDYKQKLRMAELSALDGVINVIRLWKLGDHKNEIFPNEDIIDKLINILEANVGGGALDIVWDDMIEMQEFYPPVDKILGSEKYEQVNFDILVGLGIPEVLIGGKGANFSNAWVQLQTLVEKLKVIRGKITEWLHTEVKMFAKAMNIQIPRIRFKHNLQDEGVIKRLLLNLYDRNIISAEAVLESFGEDFATEIFRIEDEIDQMKTKNINRLSPLDRPAARGNTGQGDGGAGRPANTGDVDRKKQDPSQTTKKRTSSQEIALKANYCLSALSLIDNEITTPYLKSVNKKGLRDLTQNERDILDKTRLYLISCIKFGDSLQASTVFDNLVNIDKNVDYNVFNQITNGIKGLAQKSGRDLTRDEKNLAIMAFWSQI